MHTIISLFAVLAVLWIIDLYQTLNITRKHGIKAEDNPIARFLLKHSQTDFAVFKMLDLAVLLGVMTLLFEKKEAYATHLTAIFSLFYIFTVLHNYNAYRRHVRNSI